MEPSEGISIPQIFGESKIRKFWEVQKPFLKKDLFLNPRPAAVLAFRLSLLSEGLKAVASRKAYKAAALYEANLFSHVAPEFSFP